MADYYTVALNNATGVEITGGRVGHFSVFMPGDSFLLGESGVSTGSGILYQGSTQHSFYVTSPDEVYAILANDPSGTIKVFQNR